MLDSSVIQYGLTGAIIGGIITYKTNNPIHFVIGVSIGLCSGIIKSIVSFGLKIAIICVLGVQVLVLTCGSNIVYCFKR